MTVMIFSSLMIDKFYLVDLFLYIFVKLVIELMGLLCKGRIWILEDGSNEKERQWKYKKGIGINWLLVHGG